MEIATKYSGKIRERKVSFNTTSGVLGGFKLQFIIQNAHRYYKAYRGNSQTDAYDAMLNSWCHQPNDICAFKDLVMKLKCIFIMNVILFKLLPFHFTQ